MGTVAACGGLQAHCERLVEFSGEKMFASMNRQLSGAELS
jgi:hypothetical protein